MGFLKRLLGGGQPDDPPASPDPAAPAIDADAEERAHELEILREEQSRLDVLRRRQLRYEQHSWTPPPQGGERRAEDDDEAGSGGG